MAYLSLDENGRRVSVGLKYHRLDPVHVGPDKILLEIHNVPVNEREPKRQVCPLRKRATVVLRLGVRRRRVAGTTLKWDDRKGNTVDVGVYLGQHAGRWIRGMVHAPEPTTDDLLTQQVTPYRVDTATVRGDDCVPSLCQHL